jgi:hypothetical protein
VIRALSGFQTISLRADEAVARFTDAETGSHR